MPAVLFHSQGVSRLRVNCPKPIEHDVSSLVRRTQIVTPNVSTLSTANPDATVLVRSLDLKQGFLTGIFVFAHQKMVAPERPTATLA